jgi:hypothetical protein
MMEIIASTFASNKTKFFRKILLVIGGLILLNLWSCKKDAVSTPAINNDMLQGEWILQSTQSPNGDPSVPTNQETILFQEPDHYTETLNGMKIDGGSYSFSTDIVTGGVTKNVIFLSSGYGNSNKIEYVIDLKDNTLLLSDFVVYDAQTLVYTRK